ncbi:phosphonoacetaldehyde hydrolase [Salidesulfovibrio brasiliensis]|uniref:phosphonoacetaldehyde hydrolase n=1 Tax=Salidesulfovibrio brasiliensis TaxID=221711 RepID=UPI0006D21C20|nr:phosphonoacetaldehyde hydrolase [Salidesulfovibrio brasiliensis]
MQAFIRNKPYTGPLQAAVFDWAGTAVDHGSVGPVAVFVEVFAHQGVDVTWAEARKPMGLMKRDHIESMCADPSVLEKWRAAKGADPTQADIDVMYHETERLMVACIARHSDPIPGVLDAVAELREMGLKIGSCTGYTGPMMEVLAPVAARKGYVPDCIVTSTDVPRGRPYPWMCFRNAINLEVYPMEAMVKVGDSVSDVQEGLNAGMWTVGLSRTGNEMGLTLAELEALSEAELVARTEAIEKRFMGSGAHYVARSLADIPALVRTINERLARGETPAP